MEKAPAAETRPAGGVATSVSTGSGGAGGHLARVHWSTSTVFAQMPPTDARRPPNATGVGGWRPGGGGRRKKELC